MTASPERAPAGVTLEAGIAARSTAMPGWMRARLLELDALDQATYRAVARPTAPALDAAVTRLSNAANYSRLWLTIAAGLALLGRRQRRGALLGVAAIALASVTANLVVKPALLRRRPDPAEVVLPEGRQVRMPGSSSFPSGHSASAFAFASAVGHELPATRLPLRLLAGAVAYSRVRTGVHYPIDVLAGSILGTACAAAVRRLGRPRRT